MPEDKPREEVLNNDKTPDEFLHDLWIKADLAAKAVEEAFQKKGHHSWRTDPDVQKLIEDSGNAHREYLDFFIKVRDGKV